MFETLFLLMKNGYTPGREKRRSLTLEKLYFFHTISDKDDFYTKIIVLDEIYNFLVFSFFYLRSFRSSKKIKQNFSGILITYMRLLY
jgi:hypothetical protein